MKARLVLFSACMLFASSANLQADSLGDLYSSCIPSKTPGVQLTLAGSGEQRVITFVYSSRPSGTEGTHHFGAYKYFSCVIVEMDKLGYKLPNGGITIAMVGSYESMQGGSIVGIFEKKTQAAEKKK